MVYKLHIAFGLVCFVCLCSSSPSLLVHHTLVMFQGKANNPNLLPLCLNQRGHAKTFFYFGGLLLNLFYLFTLLTNLFWIGDTPPQIVGLFCKALPIIFAHEIWSLFSFRSSMFTPLLLNSFLSFLIHHMWYKVEFILYLRYSFTSTFPFSFQLVLVWSKNNFRKYEKRERKPRLNPNLTSTPTSYPLASAQAPPAGQPIIYPSHTLAHLPGPRPGPNPLQLTTQLW